MALLRRLAASLLPRAPRFAAAPTSAARAARIRGFAGERPGQHQTPVVDELWDIRRRAKDEAAAELDRLAQIDAAAKDPVPAHVIDKAPCVSRTSITYPFGSDPDLRAKYENAWGAFRVGRIMEDVRCDEGVAGVSCRLWRAGGGVYGMACTMWDGVVVPYSG